MKGEPLILGGKSYISSKRAAQIFGYTNDYVGQLSRSGKISSILVGRDRFIDYSSIASYAQSLKPLKNRINENQGNHHLPDPPTRSSSSSDLPAPIHSARLLAATSALVALVFLALLNPSISKQGKVNFDTRTISDEASVISSVLALGQKSDAIYLGYLHKIDARVVSYWSLVRSRILALLDPFFRSRNLPTKVATMATTTEARNSAYATSSAILSPAEVRAIAQEVASQEIARTIDYTSRPAGANVGVVSVPSSGNPQTDEVLKNKIKASFSDQVEVTLDQSRSSGLIRPIFRNPTDDKYLFVIVPVSPSQ